VFAHLTGVVLVLEAIWLALGTLVVVPFQRSSVEMEGGSMSASEAFVGYAIGFTLAVAFGLAGVYLVGALPILKRIGPWIVIAAAAVNGFIAITAAITAVTSRGASEDGYLVALLTGTIAALAAVAWRQVGDRHTPIRA
jgi:hypothetical protein